MKKNIWFINQAAGSPYHGMVFRTYYLALEMVKQGYPVTVFSGSFSHNYFNPPKTSGLYTEEMIDGIKYVWVKLPKYPQSKSIGRILSMFLFPLLLILYPCWKMARPSMIIVSSPPPVSVLAGWVWSKITKAKLIFEVRDIWPLSIQSLGGYSSSHPFIALLRMIERFAYTNSDYVASVLPKAYLHFEKNGMKSGKFLYVPNGVIEEPADAPTSAVYKQLSALKQSGAFTVGYAGTIGIANNLSVFIEAANRLKDQKEIHFVIVGEGAHKKNIQELVQKLNLANVHFFPAVSKKEISHIIALLDLGYVGLMKEELFQFGISPNKIFDYMQAKIPILMAIDAGNDLVADADCGITVKSCEAGDIAKGVKDIFDMPLKERKRLGENGHGFVNQFHRYDKVIQTYLEVIK